MKAHIPDFGFDDFVRNKYYSNLAEREGFGLELITFEDYLEENYKWLYKEYERIFSQQGS